MSEDNSYQRVATDNYSLSATKQQVDDYIKRYFQGQLPLARQVSVRYENLWKSAETLALAGGKRIRPYMVLLAYRAFANDDISRIMPAAVASELKHLAMLVHDDIIDRDDTRYGIANITGQYLMEYSYLESDDQRHFANSAAVLMGDALLSESFRLLSTASDDLDRLRQAQAAFSTAILHVIGGELIDTESSIRPIDDVHAITVARYKTASYSFIGPLKVGAHLAGAQPDAIAHLEDYADSLGIAFQLRDDLLGTFGDSQTTGKSNDTDLREGKRTFLIEKFDEIAHETEKVEFYSLFASQGLTADQASRLRQLLESSGAVKKTEEAIGDYAAKAKLALDRLHIDQTHHHEFAKLISICTDRQK